MTQDKQIMVSMPLPRLEATHFRENEVVTLENGVKNEATLFAEWNRGGKKKIRNPWRTALLMFSATPEELPNRQALKSILDKWYTRLRCQAPELWECRNHVWDCLDQIFYKYTHEFRDQDWHKGMLAIYDDRNRSELYT